MRVTQPAKLNPGEREASCSRCKCQFAYTREDAVGELAWKDFDGISDQVKRFHVPCPGCGAKVDITGFRVYSVDEQYP